MKDNFEYYTRLGWINRRIFRETKNKRELVDVDQRDHHISTKRLDHAINLFRGLISIPSNSPDS